MSQRDEALVAVLVAARALRASTQLAVPAEPRGVVVAAPLLAQLYAAIDVVDAVGESEPDYRAARGCLPWQPGMPRPEEAIRRGRDADSGFCQGDPECWRFPDVRGGTCYAHSAHGQAPLPFERARMRDPARGGGGDVVHE